MAKSAAKDKTLDPNSEAKRRARRRLVGAAVVCSLAAVVLVLVLDREPRPVTPDVVLKGPGNTPALTSPLSPSPAATPAPASPVNPVPPPVTPASPVPAAGTDPGSSPGPDKPVAADTDKADSDNNPRRPPLVLNPPKTPVDPIEQLAKAKSAPEKAPKDGATKEKSSKETAAKAPAAKDEAAAAKSSAAKSGYSLQVGAFANKDSANNALSKLKSAGLNGYIETITTPQGERMRVRAGPYKDKESAQAALSKLKAAGIEAALIAP